MLEMLVVIVVVAMLGAVLLAATTGHHGCARRASCSNSLANIAKCCHLYADATTNNGRFPIWGTDPDANGLKSMNLLYDAYVRDHRVFACPSATSNAGITQRTNQIAKVSPPSQAAANMNASHTAYGYDPGHKPDEPRAGIAGDMTDDPKRNSPNHGKDRAGQNIAITAGSVEWLDDATRTAKSLSPDLNADDRIYQPDGLPSDYETFIIR
jgi:hypothetical protein